jgi:hypothetical protein
MNAENKESYMGDNNPTQARIHILPRKFIPGKGYVGDEQKTTAQCVDWNDGQVNVNGQGSLSATVLHHTLDVTLSRVSGWSEIPAVRRWSLTTPRPHATVRVHQIENPFGAFYLYEHQIVICGMTVGYQAQVAGCLREVTKVLRDESLMQLLLGQLLSWRPYPIGEAYAEMLYDLTNGQSVKTHRSEILRLAHLIEQSGHWMDQ